MCVCDYKLACKSDDFFSEGKKCRTKIQKKEASPVKVISVLLASFWSPILSETKKGENRKLNNNLTLLKPFCTTWDYIRLFMWSLSTIISRLCDKSIFAELMCNHRCHSRWLKIAEKSLTLQNCERSELLLHFGQKFIKSTKNSQFAVRQVNSIMVEYFVSVFEKLERRSWDYHWQWDKYA